MELRRFFRAPLLLIAVAVLLLLFVLDYANSGNSYQQVDTAQIVKLINDGQVKSALITDKNQTIQITTKSGKNLEVAFTVDDPGTFLAPWSGSQRYRRVQQAMGEQVCAENNTALINYHIPVAEKPDF